MERSTKYALIEGRVLELLTARYWERVTKGTHHTNARDREAVKAAREAA